VIEKTEGARRRSAGPGLEARTAALVAAVLTAAWLAVYGAAGMPAAAWAGLGLSLGYAVYVLLAHVLVFGPLQRRLDRVRDQLGPARVLAGGGDLEDLDGLVAMLATLLNGGAADIQAELQNDLVRLQAHNRQLMDVAHIGQELNAALPYRETIERALTHVKSFLHADFVALLVRLPDGSFELQDSLGVRSRDLDADCCRDRADCPVRQAVGAERLIRSQGHACSLFPHTMTHQLCLPLPVQGVGQMALLATSTGAEHLDMASDEALEALRGDLQSALTTARKYDSIRRQVVTDHLTRLYNRRHFVNRAQEELGRSLREQAPMSIVMIDIDHFKRFNDLYGHATGDRVLQAVAAQLQDAVRTADVCARYGGEEFTLLLPNTPGDNAVFMADRVRRTLANTRYTGLGLPADASITISCGVATCPRDATEVDGLLELADQAMYRAKAAGRDCVRQYEPQLKSAAVAPQQSAR
jgi:diguanylate cyclase (GGDEF)-like protein